MKQYELRDIRLGTDTVRYELERKRVKNVNLRIRRNGTVYVSAPFSVPISRIEEFIQSNEVFIKRSVAKAREEAEKKEAIRLVTGDFIYVKGIAYELEVRKGTSEGIVRSGSRLVMTAAHPDIPSERVRLYRRFLADEAEIFFRDRIRLLYPEAYMRGIPLPDFSLRFMRSRWGSCTPAKRKISLNIYLVIMPVPCFDQVLYHEFCHFLHPKHSKAFYAALTDMMPDWKKYRQMLKQYAHYCI